MSRLVQFPFLVTHGSTLDDLHVLSFSRFYLYILADKNHFLRYCIYKKIHPILNQAFHSKIFQIVFCVEGLYLLYWRVWSVLVAFCHAFPFVIVVSVQFAHLLVFVFLLIFQWNHMLFSWLMIPDLRLRCPLIGWVLQTQLGVLHCIHRLA